MFKNFDWMSPPPPARFSLLIFGISLAAVALLNTSCGSESSSGPDKKESSGTEIPCNAENEGMIIKPADSDKEHICKGGSWNVVDSSRHCEDCKDEAISISSSSTLNNNVILSASDESSSSIVNSSSSSVQPTESSDNKVIDSSSSVETAEESSSSEKIEESSSSEEITMFLCDDGVTYVLDLTNCETESSSSEKIEESSSSEATTQSSSGNVEESSNSEESEESSSSEINVESSSSLNSIYDAANNILIDLRDNQEYKTVTIGEQIWMAENLNYMPEDTVGTMFSGATVCGGGEELVKADSKKCHIFGRLYLKSIALSLENTNPPSRQGICPDGWSIPKKADWEKLIEYLGENAVAKMKIDDIFMWPNSEHTNESGFSLKPAGLYFNSAGYRVVDRACVYHYDSSNNPDFNKFFVIKDENDGKNFEQGVKAMASVRCIKN